MAAGEEDGKCGACSKKIVSRSKVVKCKGKCGNWYHIGCEKISDKDYCTIKDAKDVLLWMCRGCLVWLESSIKQCTSSQIVSADDSGNSMCCDCFYYIKVLTDQVSTLTDNQKEMSNIVTDMRKEQSELRSVLSTQSEIMGDVVLSNNDSLKPRPNYKNALINSRSATMVEEPNLSTVISSEKVTLDPGTPTNQVGLGLVSHKHVNETIGSVSNKTISAAEWKTVSRKSKARNGIKVSELAYGISNGNNPVASSDVNNSSKQTRQPRRMIVGKAQSTLQVGNRGYM